MSRRRDFFATYPCERRASHKGEKLNAPQAPTDPSASLSMSEGEPGAEPPAWVFERSPEGESEKNSSETRATEGPQRTSGGRFPDASERPQLNPAAGRWMSRRRDFFATYPYERRASHEGEKLNAPQAPTDPSASLSLSEEPRTALCYSWGSERFVRMPCRDRRRVRRHQTAPRPHFQRLSASCSHDGGALSSSGRCSQTRSPLPWLAETRWW